MTLRPWKKLTESIVFKNPYWTYKRDTLELPGGRPGEYHYVHTNGSSMVIPVMEDGKLLLVNQVRYLVGRESVEFPCGSVKEGRTHEETAREELVEETGYSAKSLLMVGEFNPFNGVTNEMCRVYMARDLQYVGGKPDETEEFEILQVTPGELETQIRTGVIWDGMTIAAWSIATLSGGYGNQAGNKAGRS
ncbi:MAG: NUDIX hydrolase [Candidatus Deferrimicrobiaceae bacterium]